MRGRAVRWFVSRIIIAVGTASMSTIAGCRRDTRAPERAEVAAPDSGAAGGEVHEAAGDVDSDSSAPPPVGKWLSDSNVVSLLALMNARQIAAAEIELENWHVDSVRAFAASMARDHLALQRSIDSVVERTNLAPIRPALADQVYAAFQVQIDSMLRGGAGPRGSLDRAFVAQQVASHVLMADYLKKLAAVAEHPDLQGLLSSASKQVDAEISRARAMQARMVVIDSVAADSVARRDAARRQRDSIPR